MSAEARLAAHLAATGLALPPPPQPIGNYVPYRIGGGLLFLSGIGPRHADGTSTLGTVGRELTVEQGYLAAQQCGLNLLVNMRLALGSLDRVDTVLKLLGMVNAVPGFTEHPKVINGCSDLFVAVFGENGRAARSAVGMAGLPNNIAVEIEGIVLLRA